IRNKVWSIRLTGPGMIHAKHLTVLSKIAGHGTNAKTITIYFGVPSLIMNGWGYPPYSPIENVHIVIGLSVDNPIVVVHVMDDPIASIGTNDHGTHEASKPTLNPHLAASAIIFGCRVLALLLRPQKEAKVRKILELVSSMAWKTSTFSCCGEHRSYGIHVAEAGQNWKVGYGFVLAILLLVVIVLESILWIKWFRRPTEAPAFQMYNTNA
ncbi:hypothetical protein KI387_002353, partial [Taxus chinensis]